MKAHNYLAIYQGIKNNDEEIISSANENELKEAVNNLPNDQQDVLYLYFTQKLSVKEIALDLGYSVSSAYSKLNHSLFALRNQFAPESFKMVYSILYPEKGKPASL